MLVFTTGARASPEALQLLLDVSLMLAYLPQKGVTPKGVEDVEEFNFEVSAGGREVCMCACRVHVCVCDLAKKGAGVVFSSLKVQLQHFN